MGRVNRVRIVEVGPRDGLQNESMPIPTATKIELIERLGRAGFTWIEATSFVHPRAVPQLADADQVLSAVVGRANMRYPVLVPTLKGLERALAAGARDIAVFTAASESFARANVNRSIAESLDDIRAVATRALAEGLSVRGYISTAFACPYEGPVLPRSVLPVARALFEAGAEEVVLADTIGAATPADVWRLLDEVLPFAAPSRWGMHFHDTRATALPNVLASLEYGIASFDSSAGGLGGCPFAGPTASGNVATEDLVYLLNGLGIQHGIDLDALLDASRFIAGALDHAPTSKVYQAASKATAAV